MCVSKKTALVQHDGSGGKGHQAWQPLFSPQNPLVQRQNQFLQIIFLLLLWHVQAQINVIKKNNKPGSLNKGQVL